MIKMNNRIRQRIGRVNRFLFFLFFTGLFLFLFSNLASAANPDGPTNVVIQSNETKGTVGAVTLNTSGGYITTINITAVTQNTRWKAFVGQVSGKFTLDDASNVSTIFDWSLTSITGEVFATRNSSTISWGDIKCANRSLLERENALMQHTNPDDNITRTFNRTSHDEFFVAGNNLSLNSCPSLNTYVNDSAQYTTFDEVALSDSTNFALGGTIIYSTIIENNINGFDNETYDFQMIVPEIGAASWTSRTAYYLYVELG